MRDIGPDIKRGGATGLARVVGKNIASMMQNWTADNFANFAEAMELIRAENPIKYSELYLRAVQTGIIKETNININVNRQQDYDNLQALVRTRITPQLTEVQTYTPYIELPKREEAK